MYGQGISSSPSERVCLGGDEAAEVQGEHVVEGPFVGPLKVRWGR